MALTTSHTVVDLAGWKAQADVRRIAAVLRAFYLAELSVSSVQPILCLAEELNPDLRTRDTASAHVAPGTCATVTQER